MPSPDRPSPALLAANARLVELRTAWQQQSAASSGQQEPENKKVEGQTSPTAVPWSSSSSLPAHLGWGSTAVANHLRQAEARRQEAQRKSVAHAWGRKNCNSHSHSRAATQPTSIDVKQPPSSSSSLIKLYPDIGLGMLRRERAASGRIWLLLRHGDVNGRGWIYVADAQKMLTDKESAWRVCGRRQLRNLLRQGQGIFWQRDKARIWLRSATKVAHALGVVRLTGRPVGLSAAALVSGIGDVRAHLYAAFHSGRTKETPRGTQAMPIARDTLAGLSGVGASSQRAYEARTGLNVQANFAVGDLSTKETQEKHAWTKGQALFELQDFRGQQGRKGEIYLAWQLPNTYIGQHPKRPLGRQKRINRELKDLVMKGMPGNVGETSETNRLDKIYFSNGKLAAKIYGRDVERHLYWKRQRTGNGRFDLWQQWAGQ
jgi:hypothetical protein